MPYLENTNIIIIITQGKKPIGNLTETNFYMYASIALHCIVLQN